MGILFFDGAEVHNLSNLAQPWQRGKHTATARTGGSGVKIDSTDESVVVDFNYDHAGHPSLFSEPSTYLSFYLYLDVAATVSNTVVQINHTDTQLLSARRKLKLSVNTDEKLVVETATGTTTGTTVLSIDTWYRIDIQCNTGASAFWEVKINGTSEMSGTEDINTNNMSSILFGGFTGNTLVVDDVLLRDDQYHPGDDYRIERIFPDGDGNYTDWTGSYTNVDETDATDGSEPSTSTQNDRTTYTLESIAALSGDDTVDAVMVIAKVRKTVNAAVNCQIIERESSTDRDTPNFLLLKNDTLEDTYRWLIQTTKPSGGAWTESAVNGYEVGLEHNQSQVREILLDNINVNVLISTTAAGGAANAGRMTLLGVQ